MEAWNYGKNFTVLQHLEKGIEYSRNLMTVNCKNYWFRRNFKIIKKINIYEEIPELLSVSLGAAETTLIDLTSAYAPFVNGGKKMSRN